jgi:glutamate---cysteine ligase / carboxylate-amine ligase
MATLLESQCIDSIREVWWDIRPHPDFGTIEFRMCDAAPTVRETVALAALAQTLVAWCDERLDRGPLPPAAREWTVRENRWLAARFGLDAELIVEHPESGHPERRAVRELVVELLQELAPTAARLGTTDQLDDLRTILTVGTSAMRQRAVVEGGGTLVDVVHHLVESLAADALPGMPQSA